MKKWTIVYIACLVATLAFCMGHLTGANERYDELALISAQSIGWQQRAEHYGGICKYLMANKPIYGKIEMPGDGVVVKDRVFIYGGPDAAVELNGNSGTVMDCHFVTIDMDWLSSLNVIDANDTACYNNYITTFERVGL